MTWEVFYVWENAGIWAPWNHSWASQTAQLLKKKKKEKKRKSNCQCRKTPGTWVQSLGSGRSHGEGNETLPLIHTSALLQGQGDFSPPWIPSGCRVRSVVRWNYIWPVSINMHGIAISPCKPPEVNGGSQKGIQWWRSSLRNKKKKKKNWWAQRLAASSHLRAKCSGKPTCSEGQPTVYYTGRSETEYPL